LGGGAAPAPPLAGSGRSCAPSIRGPKKNARCPGLPRLARKAWPGWRSYVRWSRGGGRSKEAHGVHLVLDLDLESIGLQSPKQIGPPLGLGLWGPNQIGLLLGLGLWSKKKIGLLLGLGLWGPKQIGLLLGLGLSDSRVQSKSDSSLDSGSGARARIGLWFGLGLLVCSGLGVCGRVPPLLSRHWDRERATSPTGQRSKGIKTGR
jgi:hypothetical protein